jgi:pimeloyl-ACP methyl ester carboxylesterase
MQDKQIKIKEGVVSYKIIGEGATPVVLLHGWGLSSDKYVNLAQKILEKNNDLTFYIPDLPGFGKSEEPTENWHIDDYADCLKDFIENAIRRKNGFELIKNILKEAVQNSGGITSHKKEKVIILAHSFGGRIAIKYATKYPEDLERLFLTGAAGIKHPLSKRKRAFSILARFGKTVFSLPVIKILQKKASNLLYKIIREKDYHEASPRMKKIMQNALEEDLYDYLEKIQAPTVLIWGKNDNSTPLLDGQVMSQKIPNSKLFVIENANHSAPYNNTDDFSEIFLSNL